MSRNAEMHIKQCDKCLIVQPCYEVDGAYLCAVCEFAVMTLDAGQQLSDSRIKEVASEK